MRTGWGQGVNGAKSRGRAQTAYLPQEPAELCRLESIRKIRAVYWLERRRLRGEQPVHWG